MLKTTGMSQEEIKIAEGLIAIGAEQDDEFPRQFRHNGHVFYIHPTEGLIEL